jgi:hypothetical protein
MKELTADHWLNAGGTVDSATFLACVATILELDASEIPQPAGAQDAAAAWSITRWLAGKALGLVPVADATSFAWAGPWIGRRRDASGDGLSVVMYGVPSGMVWDPLGGAPTDQSELADGFVIAPLDPALFALRSAATERTTGSIEAIWVAAAAGEAGVALSTVNAIAGKGLAGDRHGTGKGTFPSGPPGSALTLIEAEVCESFSPPLHVSEHRRNLVTRGIDLNGLVGVEFTIGDVGCRGVRLCEPCRVVQGYARRPVLRQLVHRGGVRADILTGGTISVGDPIRVTSAV